MTRVNLPANDFPNHEWALMTRTKMELIRSLPAIALGDGWFIRVNSWFFRPLELRPRD
jgi:hypothetical protein